MSKTQVQLEYWSSLGEIGFIVDGKKYVYTGDLAVIRRCVDIYRNQKKPLAALNYIKQFASLVR